MNLRIALMAALALGACSTTAQPSASAAAAGPHADCFRNGQITGYGVADEHRATITVGIRRYYFTIAQNTRDLDWNHAISVRSMSDFICTGNGLGVQVMGGDPPIPYQVINIERAPERAPSGS